MRRGSARAVYFTVSLSCSFVLLYNKEIHRNNFRIFLLSLSSASLVSSPAALVGFGPKRKKLGGLVGYVASRRNPFGVAGIPSFFVISRRTRMRSALLLYGTGIGPHGGTPG